MRATVALLLVVLLATSGLLAGVVTVDAGASAGHPAGPSPDEGNGSVAPGEHLSGALSVSQEAVDRNLSRRTLTERVDRAPTDRAKLRRLSRDCDRVRREFEDLRERAGRARRARENGSLTTGEFRARMSELAARAETVEDLAATCLRTAEDIPSDGGEFNATAMRDLSRESGAFRREDLSGHTLNFTASATLRSTVRSVVTNESLASASEEQREQLAEGRARRAMLSALLNDTRSYVEAEAPDDEAAADELACARAELAAAEADLDAAGEAAANGEDGAFDDHLSAALTHMETAEACIERAHEAAMG